MFIVNDLEKAAPFMGALKKAKDPDPLPKAVMLQVEVKEETRGGKKEEHEPGKEEGVSQMFKRHGRHVLMLPENPDFPKGVFDF